MIIFASVAQQLWPGLMEFAEKTGEVNTVTTYDEAVQESGYLRFTPISVQFSSRGDMRVPAALKTHRKLSLMGSETIDYYSKRG